MTRENQPVKVVEGLIYASPNGHPLLLDLYLPQETEVRVPVIIWLHGGGWRLGDRKLGPDLSLYFAERGFAMASIDYRLSEEAIFPAQIHDVKTAVRWIRKVADQYGLDRNNIGLWGSSSGGHLAALAGVTDSNTLIGDIVEHGDQSSDVQAVVDGYGPTDFLQIDDHRQSQGTKSDDPESVQLPDQIQSADADSFESLLIGGPIYSIPEKVQKANPITYVKQGAPPFYILHGQIDTTIPAHQSELLYKALSSHGNTVTLCLIEGLGHGFLNRNDFDQESDRNVKMQSAKGGEEEKVSNGPSVTFDSIEGFFRQYLCP